VRILHGEEAYNVKQKYTKIADCFIWEIKPFIDLFLGKVRSAG